MPNPGEGLVIWRGPYTATISIPGHGNVEVVAGRAYEFPLTTCALLLASGSYWEAENEETKKYEPPAPPFVGNPALLGTDGRVGGPSGSPFTDSPAFTGIPTVPTAPAGTNNTQAANMKAVQEAAVGINVLTYGALGTGVAEPATPFQNAYNAASILGRDVFVPAGTYLIDDVTTGSLFQLARDNARTGPKVRVVLAPGVTLKFSANTPRVVDFKKQADYDWFRQFEIVGNGATLDAGNIGGINHFLVGTLQAGVNQSKINYERLYFRNLRIVNLFTDGENGATNLRHAAWISPLGDAATDTYGNFIEFTDIDINPAGAESAGGHGGITVGNAGAGSKFHWDRVYIRRCYRDRGLVSETFAAADGFYIGSRGVGGQGGFEDCYDRGAPDSSFEINGAAEGYVRNCEAVDPVNNGFLHRGAAGGINPEDPGSFTVFDNCNSRKVARTGTMRHIKLGVEAAGDFDYGTVEIRGGGCEYERTDNADLSVLIASSPNNYRAIIVNTQSYVLKAGPSSANGTGSTFVTSPVYLDNGNGGLFRIRGLDIKLSGVVGVGAGLSRRGIDARGNWRLDVEGLNIDDSQTFTGGTPTLHGVDLGTTLASGGGKSQIWGRIDKMRIGGGSTIGATAVVYGAFATQNQISGHPFEVDRLDCGDMAAGSVPVSTSGTNLTQIKARKTIPRGTFAFPSVASAATLTLPAYDVEGEIITVTGTTGVTAITASYAGRVVRLSITGACTFTDNNTTLNLVGNYTGPGYLTIYCDGTSWIELGRSTP